LGFIGSGFSAIDGLGGFSLVGFSTVGGLGGAAGTDFGVYRLSWFYDELRWGGAAGPLAFFSCTGYGFVFGGFGGRF
jgi:hypothetical protein